MTTNKSNPFKWNGGAESRQHTTPPDSRNGILHSSYVAYHLISSGHGLMKLRLGFSCVHNDNHGAANTMQSQPLDLSSRPPNLSTKHKSTESDWTSAWWRPPSFLGRRLDGRTKTASWRIWSRRHGGLPPPPHRLRPAASPLPPRQPADGSACVLSSSRSDGLPPIRLMLLLLATTNRCFLVRQLPDELSGAEVPDLGLRRSWAGADSDRVDLSCAWCVFCCSPSAAAFCDRPYLSRWQI